MLFDFIDNGSFPPLPEEYEFLLYINTILGGVGIILNLITLFLLVKQKGMILKLRYL